MASWAYPSAVLAALYQASANAALVMYRGPAQAAEGRLRLEAHLPADVNAASHVASLAAVC